MRQSKFNIWLTSLFMMLAFAGQAAFAQDATFALTSKGPQTQNGITVDNQIFIYGSYANLCYDDSYMTISTTTGKKITKVVFDAFPYALGDNPVLFEESGVAVGSYDTGSYTWTGSASGLYIHKPVGSSTDIGITAVKVWLGGAAPVVPTTYTVSITGNPSDAKLFYNGHEYADGDTFEATGLTPDALSATAIEGYMYNIAVEGGKVTVTYAEQFPKAGVGYYLQESVNGLYLNVLHNTSNPAKDVQLLSTPQALYFNATTGGFHIQDATGLLYVGGYTTNTWNMNADQPEVWTVEAVGNNYAFKCVTTGGYLGFDNTVAGGETSAAYRDKGTDKRGIFILTEATAPTPTEPVIYTVIVSNAPDGAAVVLDGQSITGIGTYETTKVLSLSDLVVTEPFGYYAETAYDAVSHTFTVDFKAYLNYSVSVAGTDDAQAGIIYGGLTYHNGEEILAKQDLSAADLTAVSIDGMTGTVTLNGTTITVTYTKAEYIEFITSGLTGYTYYVTKGGVTVSGIADGATGNLNLYDTSWGYDIKLTSPDRKIIKVELQSADNMTAVNVNTGTFNATTKTWEGSTNDLTFSTTSGDYYISRIRVYLEPLAAKTYTVSITGNPSEAKLIYDGHEYADGDTFEATGVTPEVLSATAIEGYMYNITVQGELITVTYAEQFPKTGVAYYLQEANNGLYLNVFINENNRAKDVVLETAAQRLYFTPVDGGFYIKNAAGLYVGGYEANTWNMNAETPEVWTVEPVTGGYALHCEQGYLGFNDIYTGGETSAAFRDKNALERAVFSIAPAPAEETITYTVVVNDAPEGTVITLDGQNLTAGGTYTTTKVLALTDLAVTVPEGYEAQPAYDEAIHTFTVNFRAYPVYTVNVLNAPEGATVTLDGKDFTAGGTYTVDKVLTEADIAVTVPEGYYYEISYSEALNAFTVTFWPYVKYTVSVTGTDDATAGVLYDGTAYHNGEYFYTKQALLSSEVTAVEVDGYTAEVVFNDFAITVAYTPVIPDGITIPNSLRGGFQEGTMYDLQGRTLGTSSLKGKRGGLHGLNIVGGKKILK